MEMSGNSIVKKRCLAMVDAGIYDPESQKGIDFCINYCPYDRCVVFEYDGRSLSKRKKADRIAFAKKMEASGSSVEDIVKMLKKSVRTVQRYLEK